MIAQAVSAEWVKALRQRWSLFWAFIFPPVVAFFAGVLKLVWIKSHFPALAALSSPAPMKALIEACGTAHNPLVLLFLILGAANLFAGEYRWNTWRYLLVRNGRLPILGAKLAVFVALCAISMVLFMAGGILNTIIDGAINQSIWRHEAPGALGGVAMAFGLVLLNLAGVGALVALASVLTRSLTGSIITIIVFLLVVAFFEQIATQYGVLWAQRTLPGLALNRLLTPALEMAGQIPRGSSGPGENIMLDLAVLAGWLAIPGAAAAALFVRQDLSRE